MPKRNDIKKIMIVGSGPIIIGQACEFDYSGTQACKALRSLGYEIVLVNSNPATIMTDPGMADETYIEPLTLQSMTGIIAQSRPDALLPNLGGQSGLNLAAGLARTGVLERNGVKVIGVGLDAIERGEDRQAFKDTMTQLGIDLPRSGTADSIDDAARIATEIGYPVVVRPAYTMGGSGGGIAHTHDELTGLLERSLPASPIHQVLIEEAVIGWDELELEVVRDEKGRIVTVCFIENIDPMGVHTGDSFCTAPMLTISPEVQLKLQQWSFAIAEAIGVTGGTNVQFAHDPDTGRIVIIEINPRTSRSSALASKATGFPIAHISSQLACGITLDEIPYWRKGTLDRYEPWGDYVVVKFARWDFGKFPGAQDKLGTQMKAVGEVMSIGQTYKEAFQKAVRSLENGRYGLGFAKDLNGKTLTELMEMLRQPTSERQYIMYEALRKGADPGELHRLTGIKDWFIGQMRELVELEELMLQYRGKTMPDDLLRKAKRDGFADRYIAQLLGVPEKNIRGQRYAAGMKHGWKAVPVSGVENASYYYSTYNSEDEVPVSARPKVMILGSGPNRIGQGIEFDYCCVHAAFTLRDLGYETIMVNCNPETVSTDYDTSDKLYFEPITVEDVLAIYEKEQPLGVICQFGGQTPLNIASELSEAGVRILGTDVASIALAEDRDAFRALMRQLDIPMPESEMAGTLHEVLAAAERIGYPVIVRPSFVLGGAGMEVVRDSGMMRSYVSRSTHISSGHPLLIDRFLDNALECEADVLSDRVDAFVPAVMEHIERAGIHSGDSACVVPSITISDNHIGTIIEYAERMAKALNVCGLLNIQFAIENGKVYVLEANPRASRTVPLVSKVCGCSMARIATRLIMGGRLADMRLERKTISHFGVKEAVFPFDKMPEMDPMFGPEMRSTGEVLGMAETFGLAFAKAEEAAGSPLPEHGNVLITLAEKTPEAAAAGRAFAALGFRIKATKGTHAFFKDNGIDAEYINKEYEGHPNISDGIRNGEIQLIVNTPMDKRSNVDDSFIRKAAILHKVPYVTTFAEAMAAATGIAALRKGPAQVKPLQEYFQNSYSTPNTGIGLLHQRFGDSRRFLSSFQR
jgi:carbamoyl-phosphate synthase large subunit